MFKDYYEILDIKKNASIDEIKEGFKKQALRWHPDRNPGIDTTTKMQEINEAYLILKDSEARIRYDIEYERFKRTQKQNENVKDEMNKEYDYYTFNDDILKKWMDNARKQAVDLAKQTIEDFKGMINDGTKAAVEETKSQVKSYFTVSIIFIMLLITLKNCK